MYDLDKKKEEILIFSLRAFLKILMNPDFKIIKK